MKEEKIGEIKLTVEQINDFVRGLPPDYKCDIYATYDMITQEQEKLRGFLKAKFPDTSLRNPDYLTAVIAYVHGLEISSFPELYKAYMPYIFIHRPEDGVCACHKTGITKMVGIRNELNGNVAIVGSVCILKFYEINGYRFGFSEECKKESRRLKREYEKREAEKAESVKMLFNSGHFCWDENICDACLENPSRRQENENKHYCVHNPCSWCKTYREERCARGSAQIEAWIESRHKSGHYCPYGDDEDEWICGLDEWPCEACLKYPKRRLANKEKKKAKNAGETRTA